MAIPVFAAALLAATRKTYACRVEECSIDKEVVS